MIRNSVSEMRNLATTVLLILISSSALSGQEEDSSTFKIGSTMFVRSCNIPLRVGPSIKAITLTLLQGGRTVEILNATMKHEKIRHWQGRWYQVKLKYPRKHESEGIGWIFGAFLVPLDKGPIALFRNFDGNDLKKEIQYLKWLHREFPECDHPECGVQDGFNDINSRVAELECWNAKDLKHDGAKTEKAAVDTAVEAIRKRNSKELMSIASCNFAGMADSCYHHFDTDEPLDDTTASYIFHISDGVDWNKRSSNCFLHKDGNSFCMGAKEHSGLYYVHFACIDRKGILSGRLAGDSIK